MTTEKIKEAIILLASKFDQRTQTDIEQILCDHGCVDQQERCEEFCVCRSCLKSIEVSEYRQRLSMNIPGILYLADGTKEYRCRPV